MNDKDTNVKINVIRKYKKQIVLAVLALIIIYAIFMLCKLIANPVDTVLVESRKTIYGRRNRRLYNSRRNSN